MLAGGLDSGGRFDWTRLNSLASSDFRRFRKRVVSGALRVMYHVRTSDDIAAATFPVNTGTARRGSSFGLRVG